jgi:mRNA interferase RelE/StbE
VTRPRHLLISDDLSAYIRTLHPGVKRKIRAALDTLLADPYSGKALRGRLLGLSSIRVGRFRVIYYPSGKAIRIVAVGPRKTIYEDAERMARRRSDD